MDKKVILSCFFQLPYWYVQVNETLYFENVLSIYVSINTFSKGVYLA